MRTVMQLGQRGASLIKWFEKLALVAYRRFPTEPWTAGWGHTGPDVIEGTTCTPVQADMWFAKDTRQAVAAVNRTLNRVINQNQFDALVAFTYNVGVDAEAHSTLIRLVNTGLLKSAANEFLKWNHVDGKEVEGLTHRRLAERALFTAEVT